MNTKPTPKLSPWELMELMTDWSARLWVALNDQEEDYDVVLTAADELRQLGEDLLWAVVAELRTEGVAWGGIGASLGITRQSAWERFSLKYINSNRVRPAVQKEELPFPD